MVTSLGYAQGFAAEFAEQGTRDEASLLALPTAIDVFTSLGAERIANYNTNLINWASDYLATKWCTDVLLPLSQRAPFLSCVRMPFDWPHVPGQPPSTYAQMKSVCKRVTDLVFDKCDIVMKVVPIQGKMYVRLSAHVYNSKEDYIELGEKITELIAQFGNLELLLKKTV